MNKCSECLLFLTVDKVIDFVDYQGAYTLIEKIDRGSLKWPSTPVLHIMFKLWNIYILIESKPQLFEKLLAGASRSILVNLTLFHFEENMMKFGGASVQIAKLPMGHSQKAHIHYTGL